jgi:type IV pilus assembly protein PilA
MTAGLRRRLRLERGFSLIEVLVVILIIGILAAVAIPAFLNQTKKGYDASAKELARTAQTTADTLSTEDGGSYAKVTPPALANAEATLPTSAGAGDNAWLTDAAGSADSYYVVTEAADTSDWFEIEYDGGHVFRFCGPATGSNAVAWPTSMTVTSAVYSGPAVGGCAAGTW